MSPTTDSTPAKCGNAAWFGKQEEAAMAKLRKPLREL